MNIDTARAEKSHYAEVFFIQSGTVGALIYYGLKTISPAIFLPTGLILCAFMSIILGGQLFSGAYFSGAYDKQDIDRSILSHSLEKGTTLTTTLNSQDNRGSAFFATTLGVDVLSYAPWALLNWMNPILSMIFALVGIAIFRSIKSSEKTQHHQHSPHKKTINRNKYL